MYNARTFLEFLKLLVPRSRRKIVLNLDAGPFHNIDEEGKAWYRANQQRIALFRLPPYSPELNPIEGVWKEAKTRTTHNRILHTTDERDAALTATFERFDSQPALIADQVERFLV